MFLPSLNKVTWLDFLPSYCDATILKLHSGMPNISVHALFKQIDFLFLVYSLRKSLSPAGYLMSEVKARSL